MLAPGPKHPDMRSPQGKGFSPQWLTEVKAALPLKETVARLTNIQFEETASGQQAKACCPFHQEQTPSFFVNNETGRYRCFGASCGKRGDVIQFIADWHGLNFRDAVRQASELAGLQMPTSGRTIRWPTAHSVNQRLWRKIIPPAPPRLVRPPVQLTPIPANVDLPQPDDWLTVEDSKKETSFQLKPSHIHIYRNATGEPLCLVLRSRTKDGGKFFVQTHWEDNGWKLLRFTTLRPIYGLEDLPEWSRNQGKKLLIVEGETTRDAAAKLLPVSSSGYLSLTTMGGGNAVGLADWKPLLLALEERESLAARPLTKIAIWPDADAPSIDLQGNQVDPQLKYFEAVKDSILMAAKYHSNLAQELQFVRIKPPPSAPPKWDIADAIKEGWTGERLLSQMTMADSDLTEYPEP